MSGQKNFMKYDEDIRDWINRIYSEVESMKTMLEDNNYNITRANIDLSQNLIGTEFSEKENLRLILEPVYDNKTTVSDYLISTKSNDLSNLGFIINKGKRFSVGKLAGKSANEFLTFIRNTVNMGQTRVTEFFNSEINRYFQAIVHPLSDDRIELLLLDLTSDQKHQLQVKRYENLFSKAEETSTTGFYQYNTNSQEIYITEGILSIFECAPSANATEKIKLSNYLSCIHDDDKEFVLSKISEDRLSSSIDFQHRINVRDKIKYLHVRGSVFFDTLDDTISLIGTVEDVTAYKKLEEQLQQLRKQLDETEKIAQMAAWNYEFLDDTFTGSVETSNILGITKEDFPITFGEFINMIHEDDREDIYAKYQSSISERHDLVCNYRIIDKIGRIRNIKLISWNHYTEDGKPHFSKGYIQDISEMSKLESQLNSFSIDLENSRIAMELQQRKFDTTLENKVNETRLQDKYRILNYKWNAITNILQQVAQHWMEPVQLLSSQIQNCVEAYDYGELDSKSLHQKHDQLKLIIKEITNCIDTFQEHFDQHDQLESFSLNENLKEIVKIFRKTSEKKGIKVSLQTADDFIVKGNKSDLYESIINILNNSFNVFAQRKINAPVVDISANIVDDNFVLEISDNGGGIQEELIDRIFEPYFKVQNTISSNGLGLFVTKKIIETNYNGQLVGFNKGSGACFRITIPLNK